MANQYSCFVISPIGEAGSQTREEADFLLDLIIRPSIERFGFNVMRGDHRSEANQIDIDVIKSVQESDLCICNLSEPNINVYYELGRRDETGRPVVLLKSKTSPPLPVDIATRRYIEYDFTPQGIRDAAVQLKNFVAPLVEKGFESSGKAASLYEIADILQRVERKLDRAISSDRPSTARAAGPSVAAEPDDNMTPFERLRLALIQKDIPRAEEAMERLEPTMEKLEYYDLVVQQVAVLGSKKAGELLIEFADEFFDSDMSFKKKTEYLGCLVTYANKVDKELEIVDLIERICKQLTIEGKDEAPEDYVQVHNQPNRLYYGIYLNTGDDEWLKKSIHELQQAIKICPAGFLYYNLALCIRRTGDYESAVEYIEKCLEFDEKANKENVDHIEIACEIYYKTGNAKFEDAFAKLQNLSPGKAVLLMRKLKKN